MSCHRKGTYNLCGTFCGVILMSPALVCIPMGARAFHGRVCNRRGMCFAGTHVHQKSPCVYSTYFGLLSLDTMTWRVQQKLQPTNTRFRTTHVWLQHEILFYIGCQIKGYIKDTRKIRYEGAHDSVAWAHEWQHSCLSLSLSYPNRSTIHCASNWPKLLHPHKSSLFSSQQETP